MNNLFKFLKSFLFFLIPFITLLLISTIFYYFDIFNNNTMKYIKFIILVLSCLISGIYIGKKSISKGYLNGLILSSVIIFILFILNIFTGSFKFSLFIYYLIILVITTLGSMFGIGLGKD